MNIGLYQSAASLSVLERWQETVAQNITSSEVAGFRKRTINFSTQPAGEIQADPRKVSRSDALPTLFPRVNTGISFTPGETQPTRREFDVAIQGDGFFEVQRPDGTRAYTRNGQFHVRADRTLVTGNGDEVLGAGGAPIAFLPDGGSVSINADGSLFQGETPIGNISVQRFADNAQLIPMDAGYFIPSPGLAPEAVAEPELLQGYLEGSNVTPLREMVDLVIISRAYEANQRMITSMDQQLQKVLDALG